MDEKGSVSATILRFVERMRDDQKVDHAVQSAVVRLLEERLWTEASVVDAAIATKELQIGVT